MVPRYCDLYFDHNKGGLERKRRTEPGTDRGFATRKKHVRRMDTNTYQHPHCTLERRSYHQRHWPTVGSHQETKNAIVGKVHRLGLPKRGSPIRQKPRPAQVISLEALRPGMCSWPEGEPGKEDFRFCGDPVTPDKPYCPHHCERAYVKNIKDKRTAAA